jgi:hypothetical protein
MFKTAGAVFMIAVNISFFFASKAETTKGSIASPRGDFNIT